MVDIIRPNFGTVWAASGEKLSPTEIKIQGGWIQEMMPYQYQNFLQNRVDNTITYLLQKGIPEWDASQEYTANKSVVTYSGQLYMAITTNTNVLPSEVDSWKRLTTTLGANGAIPVAFGGTGATNAADARTNLGLGSAATLDANTLVIKSITGNAPAADKLTTPRTISLTGGASGSVLFNGSSDQNLNVTGLNASSLNSGTVPNTVLSGAVLKTSATGSAVFPSGTTAERDTTPSEGYTRWNRSGKNLESWNGSVWVNSFAVDLGTLVGSGASQVPTNSVLGSSAYVSRDTFVEKTLNYTTLRAYTGPATTVQVVTDGIAGLFGVVSSGVENGGTIIVANDGRKWQRSYQGGLNVKWFGAKGDGITDDTSFIQQAVDIGYALNAGEVFFPAGIYAISTVVRNWDNVITLNIRGAGKKSTVFIKKGASTGPIFDWSANLNILETYSGFHDFTIAGNNKTHDGIRLLRNARFSIANIDIRNCDKAINNLGALVWDGKGLTLQGNNYGIYTDKSPSESGTIIYPNAITITNSQIVYNTNFGIYGNYANGMRIRDCDIEWNGTAGNEGTGGIILVNLSIEAGLSSASISGCWFEQNYGWTINVESSLYTCFTLKDTLIVASESGHCFLCKDVQHLVVDGVMAIGQFDTFWIRSGGQTSISDSTISFITDASVNSVWKNVVTQSIGGSEGGFVRGVNITNGSSLKLTWGAGAGVCEIAPDTTLGSLTFKSPANKTMVDGLIQFKPFDITNLITNSLYIDSLDGKLKFINGEGLVTTLT